MKLKKGLVLSLMLMLLLAMLAGCTCKHDWKEADCEHPKTCTKCGETEGEALGHSWKEADCEHPKTCATCGKTEGEALGHDWTEADCEHPKTCKTCGKTEGEPLGHDWAEATTEAPKTCKHCGKTEGDRIVTDPRFHTAAAAPLFGSWKYQEAIADTELNAPGFGNVMLEIVFTFRNDGSVTISEHLADEDLFRKNMEKYMEDSLYAEFAAKNMTKEQADAAMMETYRMTVHQFAIKLTDEMIERINSAEGQEGVYYVEGKVVYAGDSWDGEMFPSDFRVEDNILSIIDGENVMELERVEN